VSCGTYRCPTAHLISTPSSFSLFSLFPLSFFLCLLCTSAFHLSPSSLYFHFPSFSAVSLIPPFFLLCLLCTSAFLLSPPSLYFLFSYLVPQERENRRTAVFRARASQWEVLSPGPSLTEHDECLTGILHAHEKNYSRFFKKQFPLIFRWHLRAIALNNAMRSFIHRQE